VVLFDGLVNANVFKLPAAFLVDLDEWSREFVGAPEVFNHQVCDSYGIGASCDTDAPLSGL
jgi:hypothetical protein